MRALDTRYTSLPKLRSKMNLQGKTVVITGGAGGLGQAMAQACTELGANIALVDLASERLSSFSDSANNIHTFACNLTVETEVVNTFSQINEALGSIDVLVNNAGITNDSLIYANKNNEVKTMSLQRFESVIDVNLNGSFLCAREAIEHMVAAQTKGLIVNISSISRAGNYGQTNYSASKAAVAAMTTTWSKELARYGIRSAAIAPGFIGTEMVAKMPDHVLQKMCAQIPAGRLGKPEEIAHGLRFIIENDYFNGRVLELDGGLRI